MRKGISFILLLVLFKLTAAQGKLTGEDTVFSVFELGEVRVHAEKALPTIMEITQEEIRRLNHTDMARSVAELPGIIFTHTGSRNENAILIRGFDTRQVPLLIDGIPVYISYDGNIDLSRFLSWDYSKILVSRGFTSLLYGPNIMGGAVNLVSYMPDEVFETDAYAGIILGNQGYNGHMENIRAGSASEKFFLQTSFSNYSLDHWDLSNKYDPEAFQDKGSRTNSYEEDRTVNLRFGYTPVGDDKYVITFLRQDGSKGIPVYNGDFQQQRWWRMPEWDKSSLYLNSSTRLNNSNTLVSRLYYDSFYNLLESYDDSTFSSQERRYAFSSIYDDESFGGSLQLLNRAFEKNKLGLAVHFKRDIHREQGDSDSPFLEFADNTWSAALENTYNLSESTEILGGVSFNYRENLRAEEYFSQTDSIAPLPSSGDPVFNYNLGFFWLPAKKYGFWFTHSLTSRFATLKERYSYRLGRSLPNPDLGSEKAMHFIAGGQFEAGNLILQAEAYYSRTTNRISYVNLDSDILQYRNIEKTNSLGTDISLRFSPGERIRFRADYSYLFMQNPEDTDFEYIDIPEHSLRVMCEGRVVKGLYANIRYQFYSKRPSYSDGSFSTPAFGLTDLNLKYDFNPYLSLDLSVQNLMDVDYLYSEGYPARGRFFRIGLRFRIESSS